MAKKPKAAPAANRGVTSEDNGFGKAERVLMLRQAAREIRKEEAAIAAIKATMDPHKGAIKDIRAKLKNGGVTLRLLDDVLKEAKQGDRVDQQAKEHERTELREVFGLFVMSEAERKSLGADAEAAMDWEAAGYTAGLIGADPEMPVVGTDGQLWLQGWHRGQGDVGEEMVKKMEAAKAKDAKKTKAGGKLAKGLAEAAAGDIPVLYLAANHFEPDTDIQDCSKDSLLAAHLDQWEGADVVRVVIDGKQRTLKEPGYEDDGLEGTEPSPVTPVDGPVDALEPEAANDTPAPEPEAEFS